MRHIVGGRARNSYAAATSQMGLFETEVLTQPHNFVSCSARFSGGFIAFENQCPDEWNERRKHGDQTIPTGEIRCGYGKKPVFDLRPHRWRCSALMVRCPGPRYSLLHAPHRIHSPWKPRDGRGRNAIWEIPANLPDRETSDA